MKAEDIIDAFRSAYDEIAELETFPLQEYELIYNRKDGVSKLQIKDSSSFRFEIVLFFDYLKHLLAIKMYRESLIKTGILFDAVLEREIKTETNLYPLDYEHLKETFLMLLAEMVRIQSDESSEIIKSMTTRLINIYNNNKLRPYEIYSTNKHSLGKIRVTKYVYSSKVILRPFGQEITSDYAYKWLSNIPHSGFLFRGMTSEEYDNTIGKGLPIQSIGKYSFKSEGTNFSKNAEDAESYVNYGRDDPRIKLSPNYLVKIRKPMNILADRDGYYKSKYPVGCDQIDMIWKMYAENGDVVAERIITPSEMPNYKMNYHFHYNSYKEEIKNDTILVTNKKVSPSSLKEYETFNLEKR